MYEVWGKMKKSKEQAAEVIQSLISDNVEAVDNAVIEFMDEACDGDTLCKELTSLRNRRNRLFAVREDLEEEIEWLSRAMAEVVDIEFPDGLPEELK
jgi:hypothetical protein